MKIVIRPPLPPVLEEADKFGEFKVVAERVQETLGPIGGALAASGAGRVDETHAWISPAWIRGRTISDDHWSRNFEEMVDFATSRGWTDCDGNIRAHIEWTRADGCDRTPKAFQPYVIGIGGTAREGSSTENAVRLALDAAEQAGARTKLFGGAFLSKLPLFNNDHPARTDEEKELIEAVRAADGLVIGSPAYHGGISGVVKNALDVIEDTARDGRVYLDGRAVGLIVTAYGWQATGMTLSSMRSIVHALRGWPTPMGAALNATGGLFDTDGRPKEPSVANTLAIIGQQVVHFANWSAGASASGRAGHQRQGAEE